jgi:Ca-activated chloride channel family protein
VNNLHFQYPEVFLLLFVFIFCSYFCKPRTSSILFPRVSFFHGVGLKSVNYLKYLKWITIVSLLFAISSPYQKYIETVDPKEGLNIALVIDTSESMKAIGFLNSNRRVNRFDVVKTVVSNFIQKRERDNLGLVVFGEYAFISAPLTYDKKILGTMLGNLQIGMAGKMTALYDAIGQSVNLLKSEENSSNIAIVVTDGMNTAGVLPRDKAIELAKGRGIKIYTIGIGRQGEINPLDLNDIAIQTGGKFFMARDGNELQTIYAEIDRLEKREIKSEDFELKTYLYFYPLLISLLSLTIYTVLKNRRDLI